jgi:hypothetical protein
MQDFKEEAKIHNTTSTSTTSQNHPNYISTRSTWHMLYIANHPAPRIVSNITVQLYWCRFPPRDSTSLAQAVDLHSAALVFAASLQVEAPAGWVVTLCSGRLLSWMSVMGMTVAGV